MLYNKTILIIIYSDLKHSQHGFTPKQTVNASTHAVLLRDLTRQTEGNTVKYSILT